jgi:hypothetical protein
MVNKIWSQEIDECSPKVAIKNKETMPPSERMDEKY